MARLRTIWAAQSVEERLFYGFGLLIFLSIAGALLAEEVMIMTTPAVLLLAIITLLDFRKIFYLLLFCIPLSTEVYLPNGLGTDLPTEPLMIILSLVFLLFLLQNRNALPTEFVRHPISLLLILHVGWILVSAIFSANPLFSFKFLLAKTWYIIPFFYLAGYILRSESRQRLFFWLIFTPLIFTVIIILYRHAQFNFDFRKANFVLAPFYRNHVNYAAIMVLFFPFVWFARHWYAPRSIRWWIIVAGAIILLAGTWFTYTRAAYISLLIAVGAYWVIRFRLLIPVLGLATAAAILLAAFFFTNNTYLDYAPDFEKTITHNDFDNLVSATVKGEDISTMERFYRWVAGTYMSAEKPVTGFGPGNFYTFYKSYTVNSFETYVSDNPEHSGIHSYYLMTLCEQGFPGLFFFLLFNFGILIKGQYIYAETKEVFWRHLAMTCLLCIVVIDALLLINDLLEVDKIGPFFFLSTAFLIIIDLRNKNVKDFST